VHVDSLSTQLQLYNIQTMLIAQLDFSPEEKKAGAFV